jgi:hypothetical protein
MAYQEVETGQSYAIPTDWSLYLIFNIGYLDGSINIESKVQKYVESDQYDILNAWQPTGTRYITPEE